MSEDLYKILGIERNASDQEIKRAYRKMAQKHHPDRNKDNKESEEKFKKANMAYEVLSDKQKRTQYDQFGSSEGANFGSGFQGGGFDFSSFGGSGFADIFETFFGGGASHSQQQSKRGPKRGSDIETMIKITFKDAVFGAEKNLEITKPDVCDKCLGKGAEPGTKINDCRTCNGSGVIKQVRSTILGQISTSAVCGECNGEGRIPERRCGQCHGTGRARKTSKIKVKIPAGIDDNSTIRIKDKGEAGIKGGIP
ncbi:J domain-containing protein, partial [Patescibacteria group bacterium]|nr:J domain-containing protein [Patescibacteria group bacterium]